MITETSDEIINAIPVGDREVLAETCRKNGYQEKVDYSPAIFVDTTIHRIHRELSPIVYGTRSLITGSELCDQYRKWIDHEVHLAGEKVTGLLPKNHNHADYERVRNMIVEEIAHRAAVVFAQWQKPMTTGKVRGSSLKIVGSLWPNIPPIVPKNSTYVRIQAETPEQASLLSDGILQITTKGGTISPDNIVSIGFYPQDFPEIWKFLRAHDIPNSIVSFG